MGKHCTNLTVFNLFNMSSGAYVDADIYLCQDERRISRLRRWLTEFHQANKKYLVCSLCHGAVYLKGSSSHDSSRQLHFAHYQTKEYELCPLNDKNKPLPQEQLRALKYNGVQEGKRHFRLKNLLASSMRLDTDCTHIIVDKCYKKRNKIERRRPDVQCMYKNIDIVFEIQLSTEFVTIISEREKYYKEKQAFLLWIFDSKITSNIMNRSEKDIFYLNNSNAFCLDKESIERSLQQKKLNLLVCYEYPEINGDHIVSRAAPPERINIDDIIFDKRTCSAYYFDYDVKFQECRRTVIHSKIERMVKNNDKDGLAVYVFRISDINLKYSSNLYKFLLYMLSGKRGVDIVTGSTSKYIHHFQGMFNIHVNVKLFAYFYTMVRNNGHEVPLGKGRESIQTKVVKAFDNLRSAKSNSIYYPDEQYQDVFAFLFPKEYQRFLELIEWAKIPWQRISVDKFVKLQLY